MFKQFFKIGTCKKYFPTLQRIRDECSGANTIRLKQKLLGLSFLKQQ